MDDYILGIRQMVMDKTLPVKTFVYLCGVHYGYKKCCINNYINLQLLGLPPAMFMNIILGHNHNAGHVLCPECNDKWMADNPDCGCNIEFDLMMPGTAKAMAELTSMKDNLQ